MLLRFFEESWAYGQRECRFAARGTATEKIATPRNEKRLAKYTSNRPLYSSSSSMHCRRTRAKRTAIFATPSLAAAKFRTSRFAVRRSPVNSSSQGSDRKFTQAEMGVLQKWLFRFRVAGLLGGSKRA